MSHQFDPQDGREEPNSAKHGLQALKPGAMDRPMQALHSHTGRRLSTSGTSPPSGTARMVAAVSGATTSVAASQTPASQQQQPQHQHQRGRPDDASAAVALAASQERERRKRSVLHHHTCY